MAKKLSVEIPEIQAFLKVGVQFGHETRRWNPKMRNFIYGSKKNIHIIDLTKTLEELEKALAFLVDSSRQGSILFLGTKRQAAPIVREQAVRAGAFFVTHRWPGGLLTNFETIKNSLNKMKRLEEDFEGGVEGRTKYEISKMKVEWERLQRLYAGVKTMTRLPKAVVVVDPRYEISAVIECNKLGIPVIALTDTNCDPDIVDFVIPGNDDAIGSIELFMSLFADAVLEGNGGSGITHDLKDYSKVDVKIVKTDRKAINQIEEIATEDKAAPKTQSVSKPASSGSKPRVKRIRLKTERKTDSTSKAEKKEVAKKVESKKGEKKVAAKENKKEDVKLSTRTEKALSDAKISLKDAKKMKDDEILDIEGIGKKGLEEIRNA